METQQSSATEHYQPRRRRRPAVSCVLCRRRKIRCDRETPCSNCVKSRNDSCLYDTPHTFAASLRDTHQPSETPSTDVESMRSRIQQLEEQIQIITDQRSTPTSRVSTTPTTPKTLEPREEAFELGGAFYFHKGNPALGQRTDYHRSITYKKRMFGQSHWIHSGIPLYSELLKLVNEHGKNHRSNIITGLQRCKQLARLVKASRTPPWPCPPTPELPHKEIADNLVRSYLHTSESVYRILHVPSFLSQYQGLWEGNGNGNDPTFPVLLKLVFAIGAVTHDTTFTLRPSAIRWVYEAETWLANPTLKHRLGLQYFQIYCLLLLAREQTGVGEDLVWISAGGLFRAALHMGLHRDPIHLPSRTLLATEMHRRMWNNIIEFSLNASLTHGGPPLLSIEDFDTQPPGNYNDDQLTDNNAMPKPDSVFTDTSAAIALRRTFKARLDITAFLNSMGTSGSYEETLKLDADFRSIYKEQRSVIQRSRTANSVGADEFVFRFIDVVMQRYLVALHMPYYILALKDHAHEYSRKVAFDTLLKIWYSLNPSSAMNMMNPNGSNQSNQEDLLARMCYCGSGILRISFLQAIIVVSVELREQLKEDDGLGLVPLRRDLLAIVEDAKRWQCRTIEAGETNIKGYVMSAIICAHIEGMMRGLKGPELGALLIKHSEEAEEHCLAILQRLLDMNQSGPNLDLSGDNLLDTSPPSSLEGWDFIVSPILA